MVVIWSESRLAVSFGDDYAGWSQKPIVNRVTLIYNLDNCARWPRWIIDCHNCLVTIGIKVLTERFDPTNAEAFKRMEKEALGRLYALDKYRAPRRPWFLCGGNRALQIINDDQKLAREIRNRELARVLSHAISPLARVFRFS